MDLRKITHGKNLTELENSILEFITSNILYAHRIGVRGIASEKFTSPATVVRLAKKMGYEGFTDMIYQLRQSLEKSEIVIGLEDNYLPLNMLLSKNDPLALKEISDILKNRDESIFINATGFSGIVGQYFYKKLLVKGNSVVIMNSGDSIGVLSENLKRIKCFLAISKSGVTPDIIEKTRLAKQAGIKIIAFTSSSESELGTLADYCIVISEDEHIDDRNILTSFFFSECIMAFEYILSL